MINKKRILFVDDEELLVEVAQDLFESLGYKATCFTSPVEALTLFNSDPDQFSVTKVTIDLLYNATKERKLLR